MKEALSQHRTRRTAFIVSCATLFAAGLFSSTLGPSLPDLARNTSTDLAALGAIFTALFIGSLLSQLIAGAAGDRVGRKPVLIAGLLLTALGVMGISASPSLPMALASAFVAGVGNGAIILGANLIIPDTFGERSAMVLNLANVSYGVGSVTGPALVGFMLSVWKRALPVLWIAAGVLLVAALIALTLRLAPPSYRSGDQDQPRTGSSVYASPLLWVFGSLLLVYLGCEVGTGGWLVTYLGKSASVPTDTAALITSGYWFALTAGRAVGALLSNRLETVRLLQLSLTGALVGGLVLALSTGNLTFTIVAALVLGLSFAPVYPTSVALVTSLFGAGSGKAAGVVMTMASLGGAAIPWLLGIVLQAGPRAAALFLAGCTLAMVVLFALVRLISSRTLRTPAVSSPGAHADRPHSE